jgi:hypothetical protein
VSRTDTLVQLASASSVAPNSTLAFYSALHTLVSSLLLPAPSHPPLPTLAQFFVESLVPALVAAGSPSETLADVLVDVVWQVDQQIDAGVVYHQPVDVAVAVDAGEIKAGRLRIAELLKLLIVSPFSTRQEERLPANARAPRRTQAWCRRMRV